MQGFISFLKLELKFLRISLAVRRAANLETGAFRDYPLVPENSPTLFPETVVEWRKIS